MYRAEPDIDTMAYVDPLPHPEFDPQFYDGVPMKRLIAWVIDFALILAGTAAVTLVFGVLTLGFGFLAFPMLLFSLSFLYRWSTLSSQSATIGMRMMGIELRGADGEHLSPATAAWHSGIFVVLMASVIGSIFTALAIAGTRYHRGLPDLILGSVAINKPLP